MKRIRRRDVEDLLVRWEERLDTLSVTPVTEENLAKSQTLRTCMSEIQDYILDEDPLQW